MTGMCEGRVAIVTGAGRGIGREYALMLAEQGAKVIVNDLGATRDGTGSDSSPAQQVVDEIKAMGGEAAVNGADVSDFAAAKEMIDQAVETFGGLDVVVNNAGILRDRMLTNMTEDEWDLVVKVHLKGTFAPARHAAAYWREQSKAGTPVKESIIHTSSTSGLLGNPGQANYGAAKSGIATFSQICAMELSRYGVRSNAIAPAARTRLTEQTPGLSEVVKVPENASTFDVWAPGNVSPFVGYLATEGCEITGETYLVQGGVVQRFAPWTLSEKIDKGDRWTVAELAGEVGKLAPKK